GSSNPFAYTPIEVTAGGRVDNVNIVLNTPSSVADVLSDPGFDVCGLGDVNRDGTVDQADILVVVRAQAGLEKDQTVNQRADLNRDGSVTFLDVDLITDIVTLPQPFDVISTSEVKRGLAPFSAICAAAKEGGCRIHAPIEAVQSNGVPEQSICDVA